MSVSVLQWRGTSHAAPTGRHVQRHARYDMCMTSTIGLHLCNACDVSVVITDVSRLDREPLSADLQFYHTAPRIFLEHISYF